MRKSTLLFVLCVAAAAQAAIADQPPPAPPQAPTPYVPPEVQAACAADVQKLCARIQPGGGRIVACLRQQQDQVSDRCKQAIVKARQNQNPPPPGPQNPGH